MGTLLGQHLDELPVDLDVGVGDRCPVPLEARAHRLVEEAQGDLGGEAGEAVSQDEILAE